MSQPSCQKPKMQRMEGRAAFSVIAENNQTMLEKLYQSGALKLRFPLYPDHHFEAVQINTAGGATGGDKLFWQGKFGAKTTTTMTTQAAEKIYRSLDGTPVEIDISLKLEDGATLFWLPQETLFFDRAFLKRKIVVEMERNCTLLMVESFIFGRKLMGEDVNSGYLQDRWQIYSGGKLIHLEALQINGNIGEQSCHQAILDHNRAIATILYIFNDCEKKEVAARDIVGQSGGLSVWNGKLLARLMEKDSYELREKLVSLVKLLTKGAGVPNFWSM